MDKETVVKALKRALKISEPVGPVPTPIFNALDLIREEIKVALAACENGGSRNALWLKAYVKNEEGEYVVGPWGVMVPLEEGDDLAEVVSKHAVGLGKQAEYQQRAADRP